MLNSLRDTLKPTSLDEFKRLIDENSRLGNHSGIILSGAEVTLKRDLLDYVDYAKKQKNIRHIQIQTNGRTLSDREYCEKIVAHGVDEFYVSINGPDAKTHDALSRSEGSFSETVSGLENLEEFNVKVITNTVITRLNYDRLKEIAETVSRFKNIRESEFWTYLPMGEEDEFDLLVENGRIRPNLLSAIETCLKSNIKPAVSGFPVCLLGELKEKVKNPTYKVIIDDRYWQKFESNRWGCLFAKSCSMNPRAKSAESTGNRFCRGLPFAYIKKFGWDERIITPPIENQNTRQILKYERHKKKFGIKESPQLKVFDDLLHKSTDHQLECSLKIENGAINPARFNIWYGNKNHLTNINSALGFLNGLKKIGANIDLKKIKETLHRRPLEKIGRIIVGTDFRENLTESKAKLWLIIKDTSSAFSEFVSCFKKSEEIKKILLADELLFGFDIGFDGRTEIKAYPLIRTEFLEVGDTEKILTGILGSKTVSLMKKCDMTHVSFKNNSESPVLHFHPTNPEEFIKTLNISSITRAHEKYFDNEYPLIFISVKNGDLESGQINDFNFYY
jgi:LynF/TruF/PatF family peptide O-prenyltransferase